MHGQVAARIRRHGCTIHPDEVVDERRHGLLQARQGIRCAIIEWLQLFAYEGVGYDRRGCFLDEVAYRTEAHAEGEVQHAGRNRLDRRDFSDQVHESAGQRGRRFQPVLIANCPCGQFGRAGRHSRRLVDDGVNFRLTGGAQRTQSVVTGCGYDAGRQRIGLQKLVGQAVQIQDARAIGRVILRFVQSEQAVASVAVGRHLEAEKGGQQLLLGAGREHASRQMVVQYGQVQAYGHFMLLFGRKTPVRNSLERLFGNDHARAFEDALHRGPQDARI